MQAPQTKLPSFAAVLIVTGPLLSVPLLLFRLEKLRTKSTNACQVNSVKVARANRLHQRKFGYQSTYRAEWKANAAVKVRVTTID